MMETVVLEYRTLGQQDLLMTQELHTYYCSRNEAMQ